MEVVAKVPLLIPNTIQVQVSKMYHPALDLVDHITTSRFGSTILKVVFDVFVKFLCYLAMVKVNPISQVNSWTPTFLASTCFEFEMIFIRLNYMRISSQEFGR
jgi:hypothetical protein